MNVIRVADIIENAFSSNQAEMLKAEMGKYLVENKEVCLDFEGIDKFTTLFLILVRDISSANLVRNSTINPFP